MKSILKIYGLPHSGTNVLYWLLTINFKTYTCSRSSFGVDYLGWKHGVPMSQETIEYVKKCTNEQPLFVFTERSYESWNEAIAKRHRDTWEFPKRFESRTSFALGTPMGFEVFKNPLDFYNQRMNAYKEFCEVNKDISIMVPFRDVQTNQKSVIETIENKFKLSRQYVDIVEVHKKVDSNGIWYDKSAPNTSC